MVRFNFLPKQLVSEAGRPGKFLSGGELAGSEAALCQPGRTGPQPVLNFGGEDQG